MTEKMRLQGSTLRAQVATLEEAWKPFREEDGASVSHLRGGEREREKQTGMRVTQKRVVTVGLF